jgi:GntR family transcriptional regulator
MCIVNVFDSLARSPHLRINANTVAKVYMELERAGLVETRRGVGTFIQALPSHATRRIDRERQLRALVDRFLSDAAAQGFVADELLAQIMERLKKGE